MGFGSSFFRTDGPLVPDEDHPADDGRDGPDLRGQCGVPRLHGGAVTVGHYGRRERDQNEVRHAGTVEGGRQSVGGG